MAADDIAAAASRLTLHKSSKHFPFFKLPRELRDEIYDHSLHDCEIKPTFNKRSQDTSGKGPLLQSHEYDIVEDDDPPTLTFGVIVKNARQVSLLLVCRQFNQEYADRTKTELPSITMYDSARNDIPGRFPRPPAAFRKCANLTLNLNIATIDTFQYRVFAPLNKSITKALATIPYTENLTFCLCTDVVQPRWTSKLNLNFLLGTYHVRATAHLCRRWENDQSVHGTCAEPGMVSRTWELGYERNRPRPGWKSSPADQTKA